DEDGEGEALRAARWARRRRLLDDLRSSTPWPAVLAREPSPRNPHGPRRRRLPDDLRSSTPWPAVLARGPNPRNPTGPRRRRLLDDLRSSTPWPRGISPGARAPGTPTGPRLPSAVRASASALLSVLRIGTGGWPGSRRLASCQAAGTRSLRPGRHRRGRRRQRPR